MPSGRMLDLQQRTQGQIMAEVNHAAMSGMSLERMIVGVLCEDETNVDIIVLDQDEVDSDIRQQVIAIFQDRPPGLSVPVFYAFGSELSICHMVIAIGDTHSSGLRGGRTVPIYLDGPEDSSLELLLLQGNSIENLGEAVRRYLLLEDADLLHAVFLVDGSTRSVAAGKEEKFKEHALRSTWNAPVVEALEKLPRRAMHARTIYVLNSEFGVFNVLFAG